MNSNQGVTTMETTTEAMGGEVNNGRGFPQGNVTKKEFGEKLSRALETERNRERRLRCRARRLGFIMNKKRGFSTYYGPNYWLLDGHTGNPVLHDNGDPRNRATLDDVEAYLDKVDETAKGVTP